MTIDDDHLMLTYDPYRNAEIINSLTDQIAAIGRLLTGERCGTTFGPKGPGSYIAAVAKLPRVIKPEDEIHPGSGFVRGDLVPQDDVISVAEASDALAAFRALLAEVRQRLVERHRAITLLLGDITKEN